MREVVDEVGKDAFRFIMLTRAQRSGSRIRLRQGHRTIKGQPGLLCPVCSRPGCIGDAACSRAISRDDLSDAALAGASARPALGHVGDRASFASLPVGPASSRARPRRMSRTELLSFCRSWLRSFTPCGTRAKTRRPLRFILASDVELTRARLALVRARRTRYRFRPRRLRRRAGAGDVVVTYHLGPVDPDRRAELFADARDEEPTAHTVCLRRCWLCSSWGCSAAVCGSPMSRRRGAPAAMRRAAMSR